MNKQALLKEIISYKEQGLGSRKIAKKLGIGKSTVNLWYKEYLEGNQVEVKKPKILLLDLENAASEALVFGRFNQNLSQDHIITEGGWLLTYAYKWLGENGIYSSVIEPEEAIIQDDSRLVTELWELMEQADFVVAHNSYGHDIPLLKARIIINGLPPVRKNRIIDSLAIAREFKFNSRKLDSLCHALGIGRKIENSGIKLWKNCQAGDVEAIETMREYNVGDVELLEELYLLIRPYSNKHPNIAAYYQGDKLRCNICCSEDVSPTGNTVLTNVNSFEEYVCNDCQARFKHPKSLMSKNQRENILRN